MQKWLHQILVAMRKCFITIRYIIFLIKDQNYSLFFSFSFFLFYLSFQLCPLSPSQSRETNYSDNNHNNTTKNLSFKPITTTHATSMLTTPMITMKPLPQLLSSKPMVATPPPSLFSDLETANHPPFSNLKKITIPLLDLEKKCNHQRARTYNKEAITFGPFVFSFLFSFYNYIFFMPKSQVHLIENDLRECGEGRERVVLWVREWSHDGSVQRRKGWEEEEGERERKIKERVIW